jgi:hypothetical protein
VDSDRQSAVSLSHLRELPADALDGLLTGAVRVKIPAVSVSLRGEGCAAFRKQRMRERAEIQRAQRAMERCIAEER